MTSPMHLLFPVRQTIAFSNTIFKLYDKAKSFDEDVIVFDLSRTEVLTPFSIVILADIINDCLERGIKCKYIRPKKESLRRFINEIGFNQYFGINDGSQTKVKIETNKVQLKEVHGIEQTLIDQIMIVFNHHLNLSEGVSGSLRLSLIETMTNVRDHSTEDKYWVCARAYPQKRQIRLCIADKGVGIKHSLSQAHAYKNLSDDYEAIRLSTDDGVTGREDRRGMGLSHIKQFIVVNQGEMFIISGRGKVCWRGGQEPIDQTMIVPYNGTIIKLLINIDREGFYFLSSEPDYFF
jgi:anti-sigma regulatory factor (Ser/Thr protein kinase)